jgi:hypothetical protein
MKCEQVQEWIAAETAGTAWPDRVRVHVESCASCRTYAARDATVRRLVGLKRHEQPDTLLETRLTARVRDEIAGTTPGRSPLENLAAWLPSPFVRYGIAAALLALVSIPVLRVAMTPDDQVPVIVRETPVGRGADGESGGPVLTLREIASTDTPPTTTNVLNPDQPGVQYGPVRSTTVNRQY